MISVVIPVRNAGSTLRAQLDAFIDQDYADQWELIIADNGSSDDTVAIAREYERRLPLHVVDAGARRGANFARNEGVRAASGDFIAFCDGDDVVAPGWLGAVARAATECEAFGGQLRMEGINDRAMLGWRGVERAGLHDGYDLAYLPYASGSNCGVRRDVFRSVGGWDEEYRYGGTDADFFWRLQLAGHELKYWPEAIVHYRYRGDRHSLWRQFYAYGRAHAQLYRRFREHGMPRSPTWSVIRWWLWFPPRLLRRALRGNVEPDFVAAVAKRCGRVAGSVRFRVLYL